MKEKKEIKLKLKNKQKFKANNLKQRRDQK